MLDLDLDARWFAGKDRIVSDVTVRAAAGPIRAADVVYADGTSESYLLVDEDPGVWASLLADPPAALEVRTGPFPLPADLRGGFVPSLDQTNSLVVLGGALIVKAYRRLAPGVHPEVEVLAALAGTGAPVPGFAGSIRWGDTTVALLQEFVPGAEAGWEHPIEAVAAELRGGALVDVAPFAAAGRAAAALHDALIAAFGATPEPDAPRAWRADAELALARAAANDTDIAALAAAVRAELAAFDGVTPPLLSRIHGDLHYAQFLRAPGRLAIIDFEGDPTLPLAARRAPDTPLRDLACLLRSIDHIGSAASRRAGWEPPDRFVAAAREAALDGYRSGARVPVDLRLLRVLEIARECAELVYAQRVLPEWAYVARLGLRRLLKAPGA